MAPHVQIVSLTYVRTELQSPPTEQAAAIDCAFVAIKAGGAVTSCYVLDGHRDLLAAEYGLPAFNLTYHRIVGGMGQCGNQVIRDRCPRSIQK